MNKPRKAYRAKLNTSNGVTAIMATSTNKPVNRSWRGTPQEKTRRRVDFFQEADDFECAMLGSLGFSTAYITQTTGLTPAQVNYRLMQAGVKRMDFRHGRSHMAQFLVGQSRRKLETEVRRELHESIG